MRYAAPLCLTLATALLLTLPVTAQREIVPGPDWAFQDNTFYGPLAWVDPGFNDLLFPINLNNHWGLMNRQGDIVFFPALEWTDYGFEGFARFIREGKTGYIAGNGNVLIPAQYDWADRFVDGLAVVAVDGQWGMIDRSNRPVVPLAYDGVLRFQDGFAGVHRGEQCGFVDRRGVEVIPLQFRAVRSFHNSYAAVQLPDGRWGYLDKRGELAWLDPSGRVVELGDFHEQYARVRVRLDNQRLAWGYMTRAFREHLGPRYEDARDFHNGIAAVRHGGKWGFIDAAGRWVIPPRFDEADDFDDAVGSNDFEEVSSHDLAERGTGTDTASLYAAVKTDGRWGYVNRVANGGLAPQFAEADAFLFGLARVSRGDSFGYVNEIGQVIFDPAAADAGIINRTARDRARQVTQRNTRAPANSREAPPPFRPQAEVPYGPEQDYEEVLPRLRR